MMLSLRARIFIVISLIILAILGISLFLLVRAKKISWPSFGSSTSTPATEKTEQKADSLTGGNITSNNTFKVAPISSIDAQKKGVQQLAKIFFERLNTYSSQSQFENVRDVKGMVTNDLWKQIGANVPAPDSKVIMPTTDFSSQVAQVYSFKLLSWSDSSALVDLQLKLSQEKNGVTTEKNVEAKVTLVKVGNDWLVDKSQMVK